MIAKIIIASTLKPVWDPRAYEKFGRSLAGTKKYSVEIIGSGHTIPEDHRISFIPVNTNNSLFGRFVRQLKIFYQIYRRKPDLLIITTHELIIPAVIIKLVNRCRIIYDVRENYNYNLRYQRIYPWLIRDLMALYIRLKEVVFQDYFSLFFLAEECYLNEINFLKKRPEKCLILQNKCARKFALQEQQPKNKIKLLLSGTISELYGVNMAVEFYKKLPKEDYELRIIGHCPSSKLRNKLEEESRSVDGLSLDISSEPVPHDKIGAEFTTKTIGLLPYQANKSIDNKVPSKLFEYLANGIPVLISKNIIWEKIVTQYGTGRSIAFNKPPEIDQISILFNLNKEYHTIDLQPLMWFSIENKFLSAIDRVLGD